MTVSAACLGFRVSRRWYYPWRLRRAFTEMWDRSKQHEASTASARILLAIERVAEATTDHGIFP
jgi:hypothetical protein